MRTQGIRPRCIALCTAATEQSRSFAACATLIRSSSVGAIGAGADLSSATWRSRSATRAANCSRMPALTLHRLGLGRRCYCQGMRTPDGPPGAGAAVRDEHEHVVERSRGCARAAARVARRSHAARGGRQRDPNRCRPPVRGPALQQRKGQPRQTLLLRRSSRIDPARRRSPRCARSRVDRVQPIRRLASSAPRRSTTRASLRWVS